ncbi:calcium-binding protein [Streptomyces sp. IBSBF 3136]|uniref:calcium-binding protein n=1 Tax=Streptomyces sp. IBSBF 3136 TaxID=2903524 RepID=UPI002FDC4485
MSIRAAVTALSGALVLSALSAVSGPSAGAATSVGADAGDGDTQIVQVVVNGGKPVVLGPTGTKTFTLSITASDDSGIKDAYGWVYHGSFDNPDGHAGPGSDTPMSCTPDPVSETTSVCTTGITVGPRTPHTNATAGTWHVWTSVDADDFDFVQKDDAGDFPMKRAARLTADAAPEPVAAGATLTVKGVLSRANWDNGTWGGYAGRPVKLQFRKAGAGAYSTVKTVTSGAGGALKTTAKATASGYWRWSFAGTGTTGAVSATGDYVHVTAG